MSSITETESGVVYLLTSPSGKQYVGQTWDYETRMAGYRLGGSKGQRALYAAIVKHGWNNFTAVKIVQGIQTQEWLDKIETAYIKAFNTIAPHGYNLRAGGSHGKHHAMTRKKMSDAQRGERNHNFGKPPSIETRAKLRAAHLGKPKHTAESRDRISVTKRRQRIENSNTASLL